MRDGVDAGGIAVHSHWMDDNGDEVEVDQDVEDLARRLFRLDAASRVDGWGISLLSSKVRSEFFKSWDTTEGATRRFYRKQARQVITARHNRDAER